MQTDKFKSGVQTNGTLEQLRGKTVPLILFSCLPGIIAALLTQLATVRFIAAFITLPSFAAFGLLCGWVWRGVIGKGKSSEDDIDSEIKDKQENRNSALAIIFGLGCFALTMLMYTHRMVRDFWHLWFNGR